MDIRCVLMNTICFSNSFPWPCPYHKDQSKATGGNMAGVRQLEILMHLAKSPWIAG